jgi:hypothetical protein
MNARRIDPQGLEVVRAYYKRNAVLYLTHLPSLLAAKL